MSLMNPKLSLSYRHLECSFDVSCYHGDSRHMFRTSTRGASDTIHTNMCVHACVHTDAHIHPWGQAGQETVRRNQSQLSLHSLRIHFNSKISLWRFKYIKSYLLKMALTYSLLYSHQTLCLFFINALPMFIFIAISKASESVLFQSLSKVNFNPSNRSISKHPLIYPFYFHIHSIALCLIHTNKS